MNIIEYVRNRNANTNRIQHEHANNIIEIAVLGLELKL